MAKLRSTDVNGNLFVSGQLKLTNPFLISTNSLITNLNADLLDGYHANDLIVRSTKCYDTSTSDTADGNWTVSIPGITELTEGLTIKIRIKRAGASTCKLNLNGLGAKTVYLRYGTKLTTHYAKESVIALTYTGDAVSSGADRTGWIVENFYDSIDIGELIAYYSRYPVKNTLYKFQICFVNKDEQLIPVYYGGDNDVSTNKTLTTESFMPEKGIFYYKSYSVIQPGSYPIEGSLFIQAYLADLRYSFNTGTTLTIGNPIYLVVTPQSDGQVKLASTPIVQALPTAQNSNYYIYLGQAYDTYRISFVSFHPIFKWNKKTSSFTTDSVEASDSISSLNTSVTTLNSYFTNGIAKKATADASGNVITSTYVKKAGDTMNGGLSPATNKGASLGTSSLYWNNIYGTTLYENGTSLADKYASKTNLPEAYLTWGGRNLSNSYGPIDAAMVPALGANRLAFANAAGIEVEYSRDNGATWIDYGLTDAQKTAIFSGPLVHTDVIIGKPGSKNTSTGVYDNASTNNRARITINTDAANVYTELNKFIIFCCTSGSRDCKFTIEAQTKENYDAGNDTWTTFAKDIPIAGWSGYDVININAFTTYGYHSAHYIKIRFTYYCTDAGSMATYGGLYISNIYGFGGVGWRTPSNMASWGQIYNYDSSQNVTFPATITSGTIVSYNVKPRANKTYSLGTSSTYWNDIYGTTIYEDGIALTNKYVKKVGDTMSGTLTPSTNKGASLGSSSLYWNNIYGTTIYEDGTALTNKYVKKAGDTMTGNLNPATDKGASLGSSSSYWNNIYGTTIYEDGTALTNKYAPKSHTHTYLSKVATISGENTSNYPWRRIMSIPSTTDNFVDVVGTYYLSSNCYGGPYYLFRVEFRTNNSINGDLGNFDISVIATNDEPYHLAIASYSVFSNKVTTNYSDIFVKVKSNPRMTLTRLSAMDFGTIHYYDSYENSGATIRTEAYTAINGSETGCASYELHSLSKYTYVHQGEILSSKVGHAYIANSANSVAWANVSNKPTTFPPETHTHSYLPLSGGTLTGALNFNNNTWNLVGDDVYIGDYNKNGSLGIKGANGQTNIGFVNQSNDYYIKLASPGVTANRTITMPDDTGTMALTKDVVPKNNNNRFYPFIGSTHGKPNYKVTLPISGRTSSNSEWMMISMELILGGSYNGGTNGTIFLSYYFFKDSSNHWSADDVRAIGTGNRLADNSVSIQYDISNPGIFYIHANNGNYNSFSIQNLTANDTASNFNFTKTTIEAVDSIPSGLRSVPLTCLDSKGDNKLYVNNTEVSLDGHKHSSILDANNGATTTFAYSKSQLDYDSYSWLAGWNGYELRGVNKSQFARSGHTHNYLSNVATISGGNTSNYPWRRIMSIPSTTSNWVDVVGTYYLSGNYHGGPYYLFRVAFRTNFSTNGALGNFQISVIATNSDPANLAIASYSVATNNVTTSYSDIFVKVPSYPRMTLTRLSPMDIGTINYYNSNEGNDASSRTEAYTAINGSGTGYASSELHSLSQYTYLTYGELSSKVSYANTAMRDGNGDVITNTYVKKAGDTMTGPLTLPENHTSLKFRTPSDYETGTFYGTTGNEALTFYTKSPKTSFQFINGSKPESSNSWQTLTPALQIKDNKVAINKLLGEGEVPNYTLDVNGIIYASNDIISHGCLDLANTNNGIKICKGASSSTPYFITNIEAGLKEVTLGAKNGAEASVDVTYNNGSKGSGTWYIVATAHGSYCDTVSVGIENESNTGFRIWVRNVYAAASRTLKIHWIAIKYY